MTDWVDPCDNRGIHTTARVYNMKYEVQILESFRKLKFEPRDGQVSAINMLLEKFLDGGFKTIVLSAPTGVGKSIIAAVTAEVLHQIKHPNVEHGASFLLSPTNILSDQYFDTFMSGRDPWDNLFRVVKGAANYECPALTTPVEVITAEDCAIRVFKKTNSSALEDYCKTCEFNKQKTLREKSRHMITNYAIYFIDRMYNELFQKRTLCVFDEGHLINDLFTEFNAIEFSDKRLEQICDDIVEVMGPSGIEFVNYTKSVINLMQKDDGINHNNYKTILTGFDEIFTKVCTIASEKAEREMNKDRYIKFQRMSSRYMSEVMKIGCLLDMDYDHAFEFKRADPYKKEKINVFSVKPIFVGEMFDTLINSEYNLICSATISEEYARTTMHLENATYVRLEPVFAKENKQVIFYKTQSLNATTMQSPEVKRKLLSACRDICQKHLVDNGERGVILTPSFVVNDEISEFLRAEFPKHKFIVHKKGDKMVNIIEQFKFVNGPCVMITPSGYEGMDLSGDLSRFQVLVKAPFASLGEARIKYISMHYSEIYSVMALMKIVQGAGRSVRGPDDWAVTYMLDANIQRMWSAKNMPWANEFHTRTVTVLD